MGEDIKVSINNSLFDDDSIEQASEYLRLALAKLAQHKSAATPVNYSLAYNYVAGKDTNLQENLDKIVGNSLEISPDIAEGLYMQSFYDESLANEHLRANLLTMVAQVIGSLVDIAGKAKLTNFGLEGHIGKLAKSSSPTEVLTSVNEILRQSREFVTHSKQFEDDIETSVEDINQLKRELQNARREATIDSLTMLNNRRSFDEEILKLIANHDVNCVDFCMIFVDIDLFKKINDEHGHLVGDKVLSSIANILKGKVRGSDFCARYGGEEFVILLPKTFMTSAFSVSENLRSIIEKNKLTLKRSGISLGTITASFGVACHRKNESADDFVSRCDKALYRAKELGRNRSIIAD